MMNRNCMQKTVQFLLLVINHFYDDFIANFP